MSSDVSTHVEMNRLGRKAASRPIRCLHARGDEPSPSMTTFGERLMSPRTWRRTVGNDPFCQTEFDVSTHVEMNRGNRKCNIRIGRCLHARGDEPAALAWITEYDLMSPRTWRWTVVAIKTVEFLRDVSTHVEMNRRARR